MAEKLNKETMEKEFSGQSNTGETKSGQEAFPSKKMSVAAVASSKSAKGSDFKGGNSNSDGK